MHSKVCALAGAAVALILGGCGVSNSMIYPGTASTPDLHETGVLVLGEIQVCRGIYCASKHADGGREFPLNLSFAPPVSTYYAALRKVAAMEYHVPEHEVRLGAVTVGYYTELDGTIMGWMATALAGRQIVAKTMPLSSR